MEKLFEDITRAEYTIDECGLKIPHSDFDRPPEYYDKLRARVYSGDEYADLCRFKDRNTALYDKRWKSAKAVIDLVASEVGIDPEQTDLHIYGLLQIRGEFRSPLIDRIRDWFDKSGDKVKLKKKITELEQQVDLLKAMLKGK
jgi:hypothetical protein